MASRISWHTQSNSLPDWLLSDIESAAAASERPVYVKMIDPPESNPFNNPNIRVIGRTFMSDQSGWDLIWQGATGAESWFANWQGFYQSRPYVWCWCGPNEPQPMSDGAFRLRLVEFTIRLGQLMRQNGYRFVGLNLSVGWPDVGDAPELGPCLEYCDYVCLHEYAWPSLWDGGGFWTLRYQQTIDEWRQAGFTVPPLIIGECGLDEAITGALHCGWLCQNMTAAEYMQQLAWYDDHLRQDNVEAAVIFIATPYPDWHTFDINQELSSYLRDYIMSNPQGPTQDYAKGFYLTQYQEQMEISELQAAWDAGYRFVEIRASTGLDEDPRFAQHWANCREIGFLRAVFHNVKQNLSGQAKFFRDTVEAQLELGEIPEMGFYANLEGADLTIEKGSLFMRSSDDRFQEHNLAPDAAPKCGFYAPDWWANPRGGVGQWEEEGRNNWVGWPSPDAQVPELQVGATRWEIWQWKTGSPEPFPEPICLDRFNGTEAELFDKYSPSPPPQDIKYFDFDGNETTEQWFRDTFGDFEIVVDPDAVYHVTELHAATGYATFRCKVLDKDGFPASWEDGVYSWPDAPPLPGAGWDERGVLHEIAEDGYFDHAMGTGEYYFPPERGPAQAWVFGPGKSDYIDGIGMKGGTNHDHFDAVMQEGESPVTLRTLYLNIMGNGEVLFYPEPDSWQDGNPQWQDLTMVTLTATPFANWQFVEWTGDIEGSNNPVLLLMNGDKVVNCHFVESGGCDIPAAIAELEDIRDRIDAVIVQLQGCL